MKSESKINQLPPTLCDPCSVAHQAPLSMEFSRQKYWSGLPIPPPRDLPNPGGEPRSPALQADSLPAESPGSPLPVNTGDAGTARLIPGSGRFPGGGNGNPLQYSYLQNPMDRGVWWARVHGVEKSWIQLSELKQQQQQIHVYTHTHNIYIK